MKFRGHRTQGARSPAQGRQEGPQQSRKTEPRSPAGAQVLTSQTMQELDKKLRNRCSRRRREKRSTQRPTSAGFGGPGEWRPLWWARKRREMRRSAGGHSSRGWGRALSAALEWRRLREGAYLWLLKAVTPASSCLGAP